MLQLPPSSTPTEPFGEVICQYTDTLCTTQKQTNLTNSLLQDIAVFNEYDSTKLEDWIMDTETAADLTNEGQAKLAKAKSRGLTHTLVMEAINSDKSWDEIKDLLWFKHLQRIYYSSNFKMLISIPIAHVSWRSNSEKRNSLQHTSTCLRQRLGDATLQMMLLPSESLSKD